MAQFVNEQFTYSSGSTLQAASANWTRHTNGSTTSVNGIISDAARLRPAGDVGGTALYYYNAAQATTADYFVSADVVMKSDISSAIGIGARLDPTANTGYHARFYLPTTPEVIQLYKAVNGTFTQLGSDVSADLTVDVSRNIKISCVDNGADVDIIIYVDGVSVLTYTDNGTLGGSPITAKGYVGVRIGFGGAATAGNTSGAHLDNLIAEDIGGGGTEFIITPSGGVIISGTQSLIKTKIWVPVGGLSLSGTAPIEGVRSYAIAPSGGVVLSGTGSMTSSNAVTYTITPTGGVSLSGGSTMIKTHIQIPTGSIVFSGSAPITSNTVISTVTTRMPLTGAGG